MSESFGLFKGLKVTFKELFRKSVTDKYPKEFREKPQRFHGRHVLNKYEDGMEKCLKKDVDEMTIVPYFLYPG